MRILVVEDERKVAALLEAGLAEQGFAVDVCHNGDEAFRRLSQEPFDAAILDVMLPGRDGLSIVRKLRAEGHAVPILLLTARGDTEERVEGLNVGADDYLAKPFAVTEVIARLRAITRRQSGAGSTLLNHADLVVNLATRAVQRRGRTLALTPREFSVLEMLLRSPGRVITRTELSQQVWGHQFDPGTNIVDVAVQRLRRKVDEPFGRPLIHTVRGVGYLLQAEA